MEDTDIKGIIFYCCRGKLYNLMLRFSQDGIQKYREDLSFKFYRALALYLCNRHNESIQELEILKSESDFRLAAPIALTYVYRSWNETSKDLLNKVESQIREFKKIATSTDFYNTAYVMFIMGKYPKAYDYIEKSINIESSLAEFICLKGWIELNSSKGDLNTGIKLSDTFQPYVNGNKRILDASLGLAESFIFEKNFEEATNVLNKVVVRFPSIHIALVRKMNLEFSRQNWDQCFELLNRVIRVESENLEAIKMQILLLMCKEAKFEEAASLIQKFNSISDKYEPKNGVLLLENAQMFSRICGRNELILFETYKMVEKALDSSIDKIKYMIELAYQCFLQGKYKDAINLYKSISKLDTNSVDSLIGITMCELIENGKSDQIKHQIDFLLELQDINISPVILLMQAKISNSSEESLKLLNNIFDKKLENIQVCQYSLDYLFRLDPEFILTASREFLLHIPQSFSMVLSNEIQLQNMTSTTNRIEMLLKTISKLCPGLQEASYMLSKVQFLSGDTVKARNTLEQVLSNENNTYSDAYLLMAQINVFSDQYEQAAQNLELGLSHNFSIRDNPIYHFICGLIEKYRSNFNEAIHCFMTALQLHNTSKPNEFSLADKASIYMELIDAHNKINQLHESTKLIETALKEFRGTSEEVRMIVLSAERAIENNDIQSAINMLNKVPRSDPYYVQAKSKLAGIYLDFRRDMKAYIECYQEMVADNPSSESYILLGDAYLHILDIEKFLETYRKALATNPRDPYLCSKMGSALVKTHYFAKAINYYKDAISLTDNQDLKVQLIDLYIKLEQYTNAEELINSELGSEHFKNNEELFTLQYQNKLLLRLSNIQRLSNNNSSSLKTLLTAKDNQNRILKRLAMEEIEVSMEEKLAFKTICTKLAELSVLLKDNQRGIMFYKEALSLFPGDTDILTDIAKLYMFMNNLELCQQTCAMLINANSDNENAIVMMADIAFRKIDFDMATFHFTQLLHKQPTNWNALVRFIEIVRRTGEIEEVPHYLQQAETFSDNANQIPSFCYCTALYQWHTGNLNGALRNFNNARHDPEWGRKAICNMIEICLNPEDEMLGDQFFDVDDSDYRDSRTMALQTADRLLKELKQKSDTVEENYQNRLLGNFLLLATKEKYNVERALDDFTSIASQDAYKMDIGPILGIATAHTFLKQSQRAKNQLKRVAKTLWSFEDAEYLERCWLLLADYYIQSSKYDLASELLKRVLQHNKACTKAYELSGYIAEKEQSYKEATNYYECAWRSGGATNPTVGYKLAFNFMKCKRYAEAIDICQKVLKIHPDYPRIKKDILDKAMNNLRT